MTPCTDQVIGDILSSWRYDISGISPEMCTDYEQHFVECQHCRSRQRLHRTVDVTLIGLATASMLAFLLALAVIHRVEPLRNWAVMNLHLRQIEVVLTLQAAAVVGLLVSVLAWILVAIATPAPVYLTDMAMARVLQNRGRLPRKAA
jgi:hypothetical protein